MSKWTPFRHRGVVAYVSDARKAKVVFVRIGELERTISRQSRGPRSPKTKRRRNKNARWYFRSHRTGRKVQLRDRDEALRAFIDHCIAAGFAPAADGSEVAA